MQQQHVQIIRRKLQLAAVATTLLPDYLTVGERQRVEQKKMTTTEHERIASYKYTLATWLRSRID